jgi:hypothetical protein
MSPGWPVDPWLGRAIGGTALPSALAELMRVCDQYIQLSMFTNEGEAASIPCMHAGALR